MPNKKLLRDVSLATSIAGAADTFLPNYVSPVFSHFAGANNPITSSLGGVTAAEALELSAAAPVLGEAALAAGTLGALASGQFAVPQPEHEYVRAKLAKPKTVAPSSKEKPIQRSSNHKGDGPKKPAQKALQPPPKPKQAPMKKKASVRVQGSTTGTGLTAITAPLATSVQGGGFGQTMSMDFQRNTDITGSRGNSNLGVRVRGTDSCSATFNISIAGTSAGSTDKAIGSGGSLAYNKNLGPVEISNRLATLCQLYQYYAFREIDFTFIPNLGPNYTSGSFQAGNALVIAFVQNVETATNALNSYVKIRAVNPSMVTPSWSPAVFKYRFSGSRVWECDQTNETDTEQTYQGMIAAAWNGSVVTGAAGLTVAGTLDVRYVVDLYCPVNTGGNVPMKVFTGLSEDDYKALRKLLSNRMLPEKKDELDYRSFALRPQKERKEIKRIEEKSVLSPEEDYHVIPEFSLSESDIAKIVHALSNPELNPMMVKPGPVQLTVVSKK